MGCMKASQAEKAAGTVKKNVNKAVTKPLPKPTAGKKNG